jgi:hypothetical protein
VPKWLKVNENPGQEWCVTDLKRDYRICNFNHQAHGGPHLHFPIDSRASEAVPVRTAIEAEAFARIFAAAHTSFSFQAYQEQVRTWKSASRND